MKSHGGFLQMEGGVIFYYFPNQLQIFDAPAPQEQHFGDPLS